MSFTPKLHRKLRTPKQATVSLDSLLGLLSSAYGTEELDSKSIFHENIVDWRHLSVESFRASRKEHLGDKQNKLKRKESDRLNVSTSTTSLKPYKAEGHEIDVTLVSFKSLERLKQNNNKSELKNGDIMRTEVNKESEQKTTEASKSQLENTEMCGGSVTVENAEIQQQPISGFFVDDTNQKVIFDIQFIKKINESDKIPLLHISESDISVNVTDIAKGSKACIKVPKSNLVSKIQYFADIDREFGLENLDVVVKCNLNVFQWILQWVKADLAMCKPNLYLGNVKVVLSMAYHLGVDQLIDECLDYFHQNCNSVLETDCDIEELFDDILLFKLVRRFSAIDVDTISDNFVSFKMKIYCILIRLLVDSSPCSKVGHYSTLATLFLCGYCNKILHQEMKRTVRCRIDCNQLDFNGELMSFHDRSISWDLSKYVELMYESLKSWKLVYWRLWGMCHFLYCAICQSPYPLGQNDWCPYHPEDMEYFPMSAGVFYPIGMYKCCGQKAFRFNVIEPYNGCLFRSHKPLLDTTDKVETYRIYKAHKALISFQPPEKSSTKKFVKLIKNFNEVELLPNEIFSNRPWWEGIQLAPKEKKDFSIIPQQILNQLRNKPEERKCALKYKPLVYELPVQFGIMPSCLSEKTAMIQKADCTNETTLIKNKKKSKSTKKTKLLNICQIKNKTKKKKLPSYSYHPTELLWMNTDSNKDNQDNQRDFEEIAMRSLVKMLSPAVLDSASPEPTAGTYIRLEADWWQEHCADVRPTGNAKNSGTVVNRTFPLSWFRRLTI